MNHKPVNDSKDERGDMFRANRGHFSALPLRYGKVSPPRTGTCPPTTPLEYVNCDLCGADDSEFLFYDNSFKLVRCRRCSLVYLNPRPKENIVLQGGATDDYYKNYIAREDGFVAEAKGLLRGIKRYKKNGRILDIGCACGFFLDEARKDNWETYGVEISQYLSGYARERFGLNISTGLLEKSDFTDMFFDVVTMFDLLSHLRNPRRTLKEIHRVLKSSGLLIIKGGNKGGLKTKKAGGHWGSPDHLYHFSNKTMREILETSGFKIVKMDNRAVMANLFDHSKLTSFKRYGPLIAKPYRLFREAARSSVGRILGYFPVDSIVMVYACKR